MNHTQNIFSFERLDVWQVVLDAVELADAAAGGMPAKYGELADQLRRAAQSVAANLAEGLGKQGKDRLRFHGYALGSAYETAAHLEVAARLRLVVPDAHVRLRALLLRAVSMLTRMTR
jgi:four helix bundle protein